MNFGGKNKYPHVFKKKGVPERRKEGKTQGPRWIRPYLVAYLKTTVITKKQ